nr:hypothetical protein GCM10020092_030420 [Actinoplanes digitatis]
MGGVEADRRVRVGQRRRVDRHAGPHRVVRGQVDDQLVAVLLDVGEECPGLSGAPLVLVVGGRHPLRLFPFEFLDGHRGLAPDLGAHRGHVGHLGEPELLVADRDLGEYLAGREAVRDVVVRDDVDQEARRDRAGALREPCETRRPARSS